MVQAKFVTGSIMRHIAVMSSTAAVGITALFLVDLLDMFFLSLLGQEHLAAAVGYAGTISFFTTSVGIGLSIAVGALVSRNIGAKDKETAQRLLINALVLTLIIALVVTVAVFLSIDELLSLIGAKGNTHTLASQYLVILVPSMPVICMAMALGAALRAVGDAKLSMNSTLAGGAVNAILDPILIFGLSMGIEGAAVASVFARFTVMFVSLRGVWVKHGLLVKWVPALFVEDVSKVMAIAGPAIITNVATPIGNAFATRAIAEFGDGYVAGWAIVGRIIPVAFGMIFALSGAIGPIIGQNYGAQSYKRVRQTLTDSLKFCVYYVLGMCLLLFVFHNQISTLFNVSGDAAHLIQVFCQFIAISFAFNGALFIANASFNNLGKAKYSTMFNVGKATLGTIPFVYLGGLWGGAVGVLVGQAIGAALFGVAGVWAAYTLVNKISECEEPEPEEDEPLSSASNTGVALSSDRSIMGQETDPDLACDIADEASKSTQKTT
ncbi:MATE family efflux transporter [Paraferrimonas sedimenticola]|uniref:MATE family efflux transporter n=1 Tax=Paraferrimonas sedimenticola TaxID=375674 RepID=A0AA37RTF4_9GAMM|nr:MATE family efflux transporter [Paraferrimonas sedimenticola]GLP94802.1 MATE family efflux transporter [Paraferrimonas sedimenticola]